MTTSFSSLDISGKTALICGASSGLGEATAYLLAARGARVFVLARREEKLQKLIQSLPGTRHQYFAVDLSNANSLRQFQEKIKSEDIHILVNNAGGPPGGLLFEADVAAFESPLSNHLRASHVLMQAVLPGMRKAAYGRIINIISTSVKTPLPNLGVSNTVRGAMASWAKTLAGELAPFGITVNNVLPGFIGTERFDSLKTSTAKSKNISEDEVQESWVKTIPLGRIGKASEVAEALAFLASPAASYITGINLPVDGGRTPAL